MSEDLDPVELEYPMLFGPWTFDISHPRGWYGIVKRSLLQHMSARRPLSEGLPDQVQVRGAALLLGSPRRDDRRARREDRAIDSRRGAHSLLYLRTVRSQGRLC